MTASVVRDCPHWLTVTTYRNRILPGLVALSLLYGNLVGIVKTPEKQTDYYDRSGCGFDPNESIGFGLRLGHD